MTSSDRTIALVTGATSGIGACFADRLAREGHNLVIVGRDSERLAAKASSLQAHGVEVEIISADLATEDGLKAVEERVLDSSRPIEVLINNAGIGMKGSFAEVPGAEHDHMVDLNVRAVLRLCHAAVKVMTARGHGDIVNVASVAAYTPSFRPSATYSASKAFVITLTEGISAATRHTGVRVSAVSPGFVRTEFHQRAGIKMSKLPKFMWLEPEFVVDTALREMRKGKVHSIPALPYKVVVALGGVMAPNLVKKIATMVGHKSK